MSELQTIDLDGLRFVKCEECVALAIYSIFAEQEEPIAYATLSGIPHMHGVTPAHFAVRINGHTIWETEIEGKQTMTDSFKDEAMRMALLAQAATHIHYWLRAPQSVLKLLMDRIYRGEQTLGEENEK